MKRNILNKIILFSLLVLGVGACKEGDKNVVDPFVEPLNFKIEKVLSERDAHKVRSNTIEKLANVTNFKIHHRVIDAAPEHCETRTQITEGNVSIFLQDSYSLEGKGTTILTKPSGIVYPKEEVSGTIEQFWHEDELYYVNRVNLGQGDEYMFRREDRLEEELYDFSEFFWDFEIVETLLFNNIYLEENGNYIALFEDYHYHINAEYEYFSHYFYQDKIFVEVNKNFEIIKTFNQHKISYGLFHDAIERKEEDLAIIECFTTVTANYKYGTPKLMPNVQAKVDAFPKHGLDSYGRFNFNVYNASFNVLDDIEIDDSSAVYTRSREARYIIGADGSAKLTYVVEGLSLRNNRAVCFDIEFRCSIYDEENYYNYNEQLNIINANIEHLGEDFYLVEQDGVTYLTFMPRDIEFYIYKSLLLTFEITITPVLNDVDEPFGEISTLEVEVNEFSFGIH